MHQLELGRGDASPITVILPFLSFLSLTLSKGLFTSNILSKVVGPISRFFEIGVFPKMENIGLCPLSKEEVFLYMDEPISNLPEKEQGEFLTIDGVTDVE